MGQYKKASDDKIAKMEKVNREKMFNFETKLKNVSKMSHQSKNELNILQTRLGSHESQVPRMPIHDSVNRPFSVNCLYIG